MKAAEEQAKLDAEKAAAQQRDELTNALASKTDLASVEDIISQIEKLQSTDAGAAAILREWKKDQDLTMKWKAEILTFLESIKTTQPATIFKTYKDIGDFEPVAPDTEHFADKLDNEFAALRQSLRFPQLLQSDGAEYRDILALEAIDSAAGKVKSSDITGALNAINAVPQDAFSSADDFLRDAISGMRKPLEAIVNEAESHAAKAQELEVLGKTSEAIKEYQESYELLRNDDILAKIKNMREQSRLLHYLRRYPAVPT